MGGDGEDYEDGGDPPGGDGDPLATAGGINPTLVSGAGEISLTETSGAIKFTETFGVIRSTILYIADVTAFITAADDGGSLLATTAIGTSNSDASGCAILCSLCPT